MEVAIQLRASYPEVLAAALWAEVEGLAAIALPDHYLAGTDPTLPAYDHLVQFAGLARETNRIELVDLVSPVTFRHPAVYAKTAVTLAEMSNERFVLGLGTGWLEDEHRLFGLPFPDQKTRFRMLEEALAYVRAFQAGESFAGDHYQLEAFESQPRPHVRIVVGGSGANRTPEVAGRYADELNLFPSLDGDLAGRVAVCRQAAVAAKRDPAAIRISYTTPVFAASDEPGYRELLAAEAAERGRTPEELESRLADRSIPFGWGEQLADRLAPVIEAGATRIYLQVGTSDLGRIERLVAPFLSWVEGAGST
jgi:alkanesulfonate monooxygenase SsuD/methylene tetrahydromethanopterin reductase-like flavin-dependent oxidoreductase (luciferase family)